MAHAEAVDHHVEAGVLERQRLRVGLLVPDIGVELARQLHLRQREVDADGIGAAPHRRRGDMAGAARHVQHALTAGSAGLVQQGLDRLLGHVRQVFLVLADDFRILPTSQFKGAKRIFGVIHDPLLGMGVQAAGVPAGPVPPRGPRAARPQSAEV
ncbi:hypothetical protein D3C72_1649540 [compost metagenome]